MTKKLAYVGESGDPVTTSYNHPSTTRGRVYSTKYPDIAALDQDDTYAKTRPVPYKPEERRSALKTANAKQRPEDVGYDPGGGTGEKRCGDCIHFLEHEGCEMVEGSIDPGGLCDLHDKTPYKTASASHITRAAMHTKLANSQDERFEILMTLMEGLSL